MKSFLLTLLLCIALVIGASATTKPQSNLRSEQHKATVTIIMSNEAKHEGAGCSATAIAEHVLLTAEHCNIDGGVLYLNQTARPFSHPLEVSEKFFDHQDHMLLVLPGVSFKHFAVYDPDTYKPFVQGDHYYFWGNPALLADQYREGYVTGRVIDPLEPGEIDVVSPFLLLSGPVVGGDSGSAIFRTDGNLAGVLTYGVFNGLFAGVYPLAFTADQVAQAEGRGKFVYTPETSKPVGTAVVNVTNVPEHSNSAVVRSLQQLTILFAIFLFFYAFPFAFAYRMLRRIAVCAVCAPRYIVRKTKAVYAALKT